MIPAARSLKYQAGLGGFFESEALEGALPKTQNSPREVPYGLFAEQINGTAFTVHRAENRRSWLYRIRPSLLHGALEPTELGRWAVRPQDAVVTAELHRWGPEPAPDTEVDFVEGTSALAVAGSPEQLAGLAIYSWSATTSMSERAFWSADGDLLLVPQSAPIALQTEYGWLQVAPGEIAVVPRGAKLSVHLPEGPARGFTLEVYNGPLRLPERGPLGANGLADARHFLAPVAAYEQRELGAGGYQVVGKYGGQLFAATQGHSPYDVVAWHGNHTPYKYDLMNFSPYGSALWDHPDPSLHTLLTCPHDGQGNNVADVVVFRGRWDATEGTFRPVYYHRNAATEFNMVVKIPSAVKGFEAGTHFLTPMLTPHGVANSTVERVLDLEDEVADRPHRGSDESLWLMFESALQVRATRWALEAPHKDTAYRSLYDDFQVRFDPQKA